MKNKKIFKVIILVTLLFLLSGILFTLFTRKTTTETIKLTYSTATNSYNDYGNDSSKFSDNLFNSSLNSVETAAVYDKSYETSDAAVETQESVEQTDVDLNETSNELTADKKLKKTYTYSVEATEYDKFLNNIETKTDSLGGYIEYVDEVQRSETNSKHTETYTVRKSSYEIRIPSDKMSDFLSIIDGNAYIVSQNESVEDVTTQYIDLDTHIQSLKTEYTELNKLLKEAKSVTEIIEVQDRLTNINYEIESYEKTLEALKEDVDYSKLYLTVEEVIYYQDTVTRFTSDIAEEWSHIFEDWLTQVLPMFFLIAIALIPMIVVICIAIWIISKIIIKNKMKHQQTIIIKQDTEQEKN